MKQNHTLYLCDPQKNTNCRKKNCKNITLLGKCNATRYAAFAKLDKNGSPIQIPDFLAPSL